MIGKYVFAAIAAGGVASSAFGGAFFDDLTEQQTAEVLGVPLGTVKSRVARALAAIDHRDLAEALP